MASYMDRIHRFSLGLNERFDPHVRQHLAKVYLMFGSTVAMTASGVGLQMRNLLNLDILAGIACLILVVGLHYYRDNGKNFNTRVAMLHAFGFCSGQAMGPLIKYIVFLNPSIIVTALLGTFITFVSLSMAALLAKEAQFLVWGGMLVSIINAMAVMSVINMLFKSTYIQIGQLYLGVLVMAGFVLFDTQMILEKVNLGNCDVVQHTLELFFDVLGMFRRIILILTKKEEVKRQKRN